MSENIETPEATPTATPPAEEPRAFTQDEVNSLLAKQKRENFGDYSDLKKKAEQLDSITEASKSEQERLIERQTAAERERDAAKAEGLRYKAAAKYRIDEDHFDLLGSGDEDTISSRAERVGGLLSLKSENEQLKAELEALRAGKPAPTSGRPTADLKPGATPENNKSESDINYESLYGTA